MKKLDALGHLAVVQLRTTGFLLNLFFVSGEGDPVFKLGFLTVYAEGIRYAVLMAVRVMALIAGTSLLTYTTSPIVLTDAIEQLLKPLGRLHFPVHELAMMMSIALRFIPTLIEETDKIMNAQKARGAQLDNGKMTERIKALVPVLVPLFISAFRRAGHGDSRDGEVIPLKNSGTPISKRGSPQNTQCTLQGRYNPAFRTAAP